MKLPAGKLAKSSIGLRTQSTQLLSKIGGSSPMVGLNSRYDICRPRLTAQTADLRTPVANASHIALLTEIGYRAKFAEGKACIPSSGACERICDELAYSTVVGRSHRRGVVRGDEALGIVRSLWLPQCLEMPP